MLHTLKYLLGSAGPTGFGSKSTAQQVTQTSTDLRSITAIITCATSGIGAETARVLAAREARLVLPARSLKAAEDAKARIVSECPDSEIIVMPLDLSSLNSVNNFVAHFHSLGLPLHLLINNAGKFAPEHAISEDGVEMTFATNYLVVEDDGGNGEGDRIARSDSEHVVKHTRMVFWCAISYLALISRNKSHYDATRAYALSKLANVFHTKELARRLKFALAKNYGHASLLAEDENYSKAVWPNIPIPNALRELLKQSPKGEEPNDSSLQSDGTQYPTTVFLQRDMYPGKTINLQFTSNPSDERVNRFYHDSNLTKTEYTFKDLCIDRSVKGEERFCTKSLRTIIDFVTSKQGKSVKMVSGSFVKNQEQYTMERVQNHGTKGVMCHSLKFKNYMFYCHEITHATLFTVPLVAGDGTKSEALAICHTHILGVDDALLRRAINFNPGNNPLCHFSEDKTVAWVPRNNNA